MQIDKRAGSRAAADRDGNGSRRRSAALIPFLYDRVVCARGEGKQRVELRALPLIGEHTGRRIDSHRGDAAGARGSSRGHILHRGADGGVGLRSADGDLPTAVRARNLDGDGSSGTASAAIPLLYDGVVGAGV